MEAAMTEITYWYHQYYGDNVLLIMAMASYVYLFVYEKKERKRFLYPIALLVFCVLNPLLYFLVFYQIIYWRMFWVIPDALVIAYAATKLVKANKKNLDKILVLAIMVVFLAFNGKNIYKRGGFTFIQNPEKIDREVKAVCDIMLEMEDSPRCILPRPFLSQARQYSGKIQSMYGRNVEGYILDANEDQWGMYYKMESGTVNFNFVFRVASEQGYNFVVTYEWNEALDSVLERYHFREIDVVGDYRIYYSGAE